MKVSGEQKLIPQAEEQITKLEWVEKNDLKKYLQNSFPSVMMCLKQGFHPDTFFFIIATVSRLMQINFPSSFVIRISQT